MGREEALKTRRLLEAAEAGTDTPSDTKFPRCPVDKVAVAAGALGYAVPFSFISQEKFLSFLVANSTAAARQSLDAALFGRLASAEDEAGEQPDVLCSVDKTLVAEWMSAFPETATPEEIMEAKSAVMRRLCSKIEPDRAIDLAKLTRRTLELTSTAISLSISPKDGKVGEVFSALLTLLPLKQVVQLDAKLTNALAVSVQE